MEVYSYEQALEASTQYFNGDGLASKVFVDKYALRDNDGHLLEDEPSKMHVRLAKEFARIEKNKFKNPLKEDEIFGLFDKFQYIVPQGSPMYGIGNNFQIISLSNCYVCTPPEDSYGAILSTDEEMVQICKRRGGVGTDISHLRPSDAPVKNAAKSSTGVPTFMGRYSNSIREVGQQNRRGALILTISVHHPDAVRIDEDGWDDPTKIVLAGNHEKGERDIITDSRFYDAEKPDFCSIKLDRSKITGANVSIRLSDEFLNAVRNGEKFEQCFPVDYKKRGVKPMMSKMVDARKVWQKIIHAAWQSAEPGLIFWDRVVTYNAVDCYAEFGFETVSTNPCSELPLCLHDSCRLLLQNLFSYVVNPFTKNAFLDYDKFREHAKKAQRLMDDLVDLEIEKIDAIISKIIADPENLKLKLRELELWKSIRKMCANGRRTGLGITAMGDALAALGIRYGSEESIEAVDKIQRVQKLASFESSCDMAKEIGAFPIWNWELEKNSDFLKQIAKESSTLYDNISKYGRRNIANLTIAPAGSVSILTQTSSGIEPLFNLAPYKRRKKINYDDKSSRVDFVDASGDKWQEFEIYHPKVKQWMETTGESDLSKSPWHGACANDLNWINRVRLQAVAQKHIDHAISSTINLPSDVSEEEVSKIYTAAWEHGCKGITVYRNGCRSGVLISNPKINNDKIQKTIPPKRPESLPCNVHHTTVKGHRYYVVVGLFGEDAYETFVGSNHDHDGEIIIPKTVNAGKVKKIGSGSYVLIAGEKEYKLNNGHSDPNADALTRMVSCSLRHGADIAFAVEQLEKTHGDLFAFAKVLARTLKKYIKDGAVTGEICEKCKKESGVEVEKQRKDGCSICPNCGDSKCS